MIRYKTAIVGIGMFFFSFILWACGEASDEMVLDEKAIAQEIEASPLFDIEVLDDDALSASFRLQGLTLFAESDCRPLAWRRLRQDHVSRDIQISIKDQNASVTVTDEVAGVLLVDNTPDEEINPFEKSFDHLFRRHAAFQRTPFGWNLTAISPVEAVVAEPADQTVQIQRVGAKASGATIWEIDSPSESFSVPNGIPQLASGEMVLVEARVVNAEPGVCVPDRLIYLHRRGDNGAHIRELMADDGIDGDLTAGDGVFSKTFVVGDTTGIRFAVVDAIDGDTFADELTAYRAQAWGIPYRVVSP